MSKLTFNLRRLENRTCYFPTSIDYSLCVDFKEQSVKWLHIFFPNGTAEDFIKKINPLDIFKVILFSASLFIHESLSVFIQYSN